MIKDILLVGFGGFAGSVLRYLLNILLINYHWPIPWPTYLINLSGSLLIGILMALNVKEEEYVRLLVITGFCGGFTTFSTFSYENLNLFQEGHPQVALFYMFTSVLFGLLFVYLGYFITQRIIS
jgi:CrcB protein